VRRLLAKVLDALLLVPPVALAARALGVEPMGGSGLALHLLVVATHAWLVARALALGFLPIVGVVVIGATAVIVQVAYMTLRYLVYAGGG
jgi:hypothetical protein